MQTETSYTFQSLSKLPFWVIIVQNFVLLAVLKPIFSSIEQTESVLKTCLLIALFLIIAIGFALVSARVLKYFYKDCGLFVTKEHLLYKPNKYVNCKVNWSDILAVEYRNGKLSTFILLQVSNAEQIIQSQNSRRGNRYLKRKAKEFKTPIAFDPMEFGLSYYQANRLLKEFARLN